MLGRVSDRVRLGVGAVAIGGALLLRDPGVLAALFVAVLLPAAVVSGITRWVRRLLLGLVLPMSTLLVLVWGVLHGARPGEPAGSDPRAGFEYASLISLRVASIGLAAQLVVLPVPADERPRMFHRWGLRGPVLVAALGAFFTVPETSRRIREVLEAWMSRGMMRDRGLVSRAKALVPSAGGVFVTAVMTALDRAALWRARELLERLDRTPPKTVGASTPVVANARAAACAPDSAPEMAGGTTLAPDRPGRLTLLDGPNFSGRSNELRRSVCAGAVIGPQIRSSLSGLAETVRGELWLNSADVASLGDAIELARIMGFDAGSCRHPLEMSGGESAMLALLAAVASGAESIGLDTVLEQLDPDRRTAALLGLRGIAERRGIRIMIADNRWREWGARIERIFDIVRTEPAPGGSPRIRADAGGLFEPADAPRISLRDASFGYGDAGDVLRSVSLDLEPGRVYRFSGENGAGKSTLAKLLVGVLRPRSGRVLADGDEFSPYRNPGHVVSFHAQDADVQLFRSSVRREVLSGAGKGGRGVGAERVDRFLGVFGLDGCGDDQPFDLPFVLRKRLAVASTIATLAPWVVIDEPTIGQDEENCGNLAALLAGYARSGRGVVFITHSDRFATSLDHAVLRVAGGRVES